MASRNAKQQGGGMYDTPEKLQSNTLKRHPKMDLNKADLLRLLSYLEGELQARDVVIATLKAEKAKQLLYQAKYGRFGLGDPFMALQRDSDNMKDNTFDESAIKAMYDNQLAQLENLIATQRKAQLKMREQLTMAEKRHHKVCNELEEEKRKHAQDTAQGDDVTYMLEKERERLRQEIDYEKSQNKKMEKDLKRTLANLEEERANSIKHKQVAVMLIKEQKKLIEKLVKDRKKITRYEELLKEEKDKTTNVVEGLVQESKKSLKMEAAMEKQLSDFDVEKEQLKGKLAKEEMNSRDLMCQVQSLQQQVEMLQKQLIAEKAVSKDAFQSIEIKSSANPSRGPTEKYNDASLAVVSPTVGKPSPKYNKPMATESSLRITESPDRSRSTIEGNVQRTRAYGIHPVSRSPDRQYNVDEGYRVESPELRIAPVGAASADKSGAESYRTRVSTSSPGGKILTVNVSHPNPAMSAGNMSPRKMGSSGSPGGRGTPPPLPPNKPNLSSPTPQQQNPKPTVPSRIGVTVSKDRGVASTGQESPSSSPRGVHIPVSVVHSSGTVIPTGRGGTANVDKTSSPLRKPAQSSEPVKEEITSTQSNTTHADALEFLGPEMADLQNLLSSIMSGPEMEELQRTMSIMSDSDSTYHLDSSLSSVTSTASSLSSADLPALPILMPATSGYSSLFQKLATDVDLSPLHKCAADGNLEALCRMVLEREADVNLPLKDGSTPLLFAVKNGKNECVKFLLDNGANPASAGDSRFSPLHAAAAEGHDICVKLLLDHGVSPNVSDIQNWTPLHLAATHGHGECCHALLQYGAKLNVFSATSWTPLHCVVHAGHHQCLDHLFDHQSKLCQTSAGLVTSQELLDTPDSNGWTVAYIAATKSSTKCLEVILKYCNISLTCRNRWGRTILDVATPTCRQLLSHIAVGNQSSIKVYLDIRYLNLQGEDNSVRPSNHSFVIGTVQLGVDTGWSELESRLASTLTDYYSHLDTGLKTKKTSRLDPEMTCDSLPYTLGLGIRSIDHYEIGSYSWTPGFFDDGKSPSDVVNSFRLRKIVIVLQDSIEAIACDVLFPVSVLHNYLRLLEHYKSVVFYGPEFTGKSYLSKLLAHLIAKKELSAGRLPSIYRLSLHEDFSHQDLVNTLLQTGCMLRNKTEAAETCAPILILDDLETINISQVFGKLLQAVEHRGQYHAFSIDANGTGYYFVDNFYILATMNKSRSTGLDLAIQQRFRWVHFRIDIEPIRSLLARHFLRQLIHSGDGNLPQCDSQLFRAVEWVVCVWQRLNDGVVKLGLQDVVFGPYQFLSCPLDSKDASAVYSWMSMVWNEMIAPTVREAVIRGTGKDTSVEGQQKVANTALYVLMQKSVVPGCPLSGSEKENFLCSFSGSNELELQMKMEKSRLPVANGNHGRRSMGTNLSRHPSNKHKHRSSMGSEEQEAIPSSLTSKRRSLSETSLKKSIEYEEKKTDIEAINLSAKVRKLEIRPPAIFQFNSPLRSSSPLFSTESGIENSDMPLRTFSFSATTKSSIDSNGNSSQPSSSRRSWSSENLSGGGSRKSSDQLASKMKPTIPFSFSLTTPTSSLSSFKHLEKRSIVDASQTRVSSRRSLNSLEDHMSRKNAGSHRSFFLSGLKTNVTKRLSHGNDLSYSQSFDSPLSDKNQVDENANMDCNSAEDVWIPREDSQKVKESNNQGHKPIANRFIRNSKVRKSIEKIISDSPFTRDSEKRRSVGKGDTSVVRNSGIQKTYDRNSSENKFIVDSNMHRSAEQEQEFIRQSSQHSSFGKGRNNVESEC